MKTSKSRIVHIGDTFSTDIMGILAFGGQAIWLNSSKDALELAEKSRKKIYAIIPDIGSLLEIILGYK